MSYVIFNDVLGFWTGHKFSSEFPDARIYASKRTAERVAKSLGSGCTVEQCK